VSHCRVHLLRQRPPLGRPARLCVARRSNRDTPRRHPADKRVQAEIVAAGPAQQISLARAPRAARSPRHQPGRVQRLRVSLLRHGRAIVKQLLAAYPAQVRFAFKHYPLPMHKESPLAHEAAAAAGEQSKFWEMHDLLFAETAGTDGQRAGADQTG